MRVALVGPYPLDRGKIGGGVEAAIFCLAQALKEMDDVELHILASTNLVSIDRVVEEDRLTIHYLAEPNVRLIPNQIANIGRLHAAIERIGPDIVHSATASGTLAGLKAGCPTIHNIHGIIHGERRFADTIEAKLRFWLLSSISKRAVSRAKHVISVSPYASSEYARFTRAKFHNIPNPVDDIFFLEHGDEIPGRMIYAGHISPLKNVLGLVRAFETIKTKTAQAELNVAGGPFEPTDAAYCSEVDSYIAERGLGSSVHMLGRVDQERISREYCEASLVCLFSNQESFSLAVAQGMAAGRPVVCTKSGGPQDLVVDGETGFLVDIGDEQAFADKASRLLEDTNTRRQMGRRAREVAESRFRKEAVARQVMVAYAETIADG